jgi:hypothetical protein
MTTKKNSVTVKRKTKPTSRSSGRRNKRATKASRLVRVAGEPFAGKMIGKKRSTKKPSVRRSSPRRERAAATPAMSNDRTKRLRTTDRHGNRITEQAERSVVHTPAGPINVRVRTITTKVQPINVRVRKITTEVPVVAYLPAKREND